MKFALVLLAVTVCSAHWTHDESLAREIGAPPGEEDVEVANLGESDSLGAIKNYRITFGTTVAGGKLGSSNSQFKVHLKGARPKAPKAGQATAWSIDTDWKSADGGIMRYYQGAFLSYALAKSSAPELHPGMTPLVDTLQAGCSNLKNGKMKPCPAATAATLDSCEPGAKACKNSIKMAQVAWTDGKVTQLVNGINFDTNTEEQGPKMGPIQRGQFEMEDVGKIVAVKISEVKSYTPSDACYSKATGFRKAACSSPWRPAFVKINTNDAKTGIGDGVFYIAPCDAATLKVGVYVMSGGKGQPDIEKGPVDLLALPLAAGDSKCPKSQNAILTKCAAQTCEEEMDTRLGLMDTERYEFAEEI